MEDPIDRGAEDDQISYANRDKEIDVIDGGGDDVVAGVTVRSHGAGEIDPVHQTSAEQGRERIGVVGQDDFRHRGLRIADRAGGQGVICHVVVLFLGGLWFDGTLP